MSFAAPGWLLLLGLIPLLFLLRARRRQEVLAGTLIVWRRFAASAARTVGQAHRSRFNLRLFLQVIAIVGLALALARPTLTGETRADHHVFLIDLTRVSLDGAPGGRLEPELVTALRLTLGRLGPAEVATVVLVDHAPRLIAARQDPRLGLIGLLDTFTGSSSDPDWDAALALVLPLLGSSELTSFVVIGDGRSSYGARSALDALGRSDALRTYLPGTGRTHPFLDQVVMEPSAEINRWTLSGVVATGPSATVAAEVAVLFEPLGTRGFLPWATVPVPSDPGGRVAFSIALELPGSGTVELRLLVPGASGHVDALTLPVEVEPDAVNVLRIGEPHPALDRALLLVPHLRLWTASALPDDVEDFDLVIVSSQEIEEVPATSTLWLGVAPPGITSTGDSEDPRPTGWRPSHPLSRGVDWTTLTVARAMELPLLLGAQALVSASDTPLIQARTVEVGRQVVVAFSLDDTDWERQPGFPLFVARLVDWSVPDRDLAGGSVCQTGSVCGLPREAFGSSWHLVDPHGRTVSTPRLLLPVADDPLTRSVWVEGSFDALFVPRVAGMHRLVFEDGTASVPLFVRMPSGEALDPSSMPEDESVAEAVEPGPLASMTGGDGAWRWLAWKVLAALVLEAFLGFPRRAPILGQGAHGARRIGVILMMAGALATTLAGIVSLSFPIQVTARGQVLLIDRRGEEQLAVASPRPPGALTVRVVGADAPLGWSADPPVTDAPDLPTALAIATAWVPPEVPGRLRISAASTTATPDPRLLHTALVAARPGSGISFEGSGSASALSEPTIRFLPVYGSVRAGDVKELPIVVTAEGTVSVNLRVEVDGEEVLWLPGVLVEGPTRFDLPVLFDQTGPRIVTVDITTMDTGTLGTGATTVVEVGSAPRVLLLTSDLEPGRVMAEALRLQGIEVEVQPPINAPWTVEGWLAYDGALLMNLPAVDLHTVQQELLEVWIRQHGGGLAILGGENAFGPGGYFRTPLEAMSPLSSRVPADAPEVAMVFVVDRSGSMSQRVGASNRMELAKEATIGALELLAPESVVGLIAFDAEAEVLMPMQPVTQVEAFLRAVEGLRAAGGTALHPALVEAYTLLQGVDSATKHVVVLTDGLSQPADFVGILSRLREIGVTTSMVGIGDGADRIQLTELARLGGGAFHHTTDVRALPSILAQEAMMLSSTPIKLDRTLPRWVSPGVGFLAGLDTDPIAVGGYVATTLQPGALAHLVVPDDDDSPLLASWRYGLGQVVAFASHGAGAWARDWILWPGYAQLWSQVVRWTVSAMPRAGLQVNVRSSGLGADVEAYLLGDDGRAATGQGLTVALVSDEGELVGTHPLLEISPGEHVGRIEVSGPGTYRLRVTASGGGGHSVDRRVVIEQDPSTVDAGVSLAWLEAVLGDPLTEARGQGAAEPLARLWVMDRRGWLWLVFTLILYMAALLLRYGVGYQLRSLDRSMR